MAKGATALIDAARFPADTGDTPYLMPQVLTGVDHSMKVMMEESFGPVVGIMKVASDEEAIRLMNDSPYGLTASVWTSDEQAAERIGDADRDRHRIHEPLRLSSIPILAWTGVKDTGRGAGMSRLGISRP